MELDFKLDLDPSLPIQRQLLAKFSSVVLVAFCIELFIFCLSTFALGRTTSSMAYFAMYNQTTRQITSSVRELGDVVSSKLKNIDVSIVEPMAITLEQIYSDDYPLLRNISQTGRPFNQSEMPRAPQSVGCSDVRRTQGFCLCARGRALELVQIW